MWPARLYAGTSARHGLVFEVWCSSTHSFDLGHNFEVHSFGRCAVSITTKNPAPHNTIRQVAVSASVLIVLFMTCCALCLPLGNVTSTPVYLRYCKLITLHHINPLGNSCFSSCLVMRQGSPLTSCWEVYRILLTGQWMTGSGSIRPGYMWLLKASETGWRRQPNSGRKTMTSPSGQNRWWSVLEGWMGHHKIQDRWNTVVLRVIPRKWCGEYSCPRGQPCQGQTGTPNTAYKALVGMAASDDKPVPLPISLRLPAASESSSDDEDLLAMVRDTIHPPAGHSAGEV